MDLILWRHAEAADARAGQDDLDRALTPAGRDQAARMGAWLARHLSADVRICASPALRTQQTAAGLGTGRSVETVAALAPGLGAEALLRAVHWPAARTPVLVVGHQPTLGMTAARLLSGRSDAWSVRKAAVWWLRGRDRDGALQVVLQAVVGVEHL